jgi:hypothetical protein
VPGSPWLLLTEWGEDDVRNESSLDEGKSIEMALIHLIHRPAFSSTDRVGTCDWLKWFVETASPAVMR